MDIRAIRKLLDEAEAVSVPNEPPTAYGEPVYPDETPVGHVPLDARKLYTLAQLKADFSVQCVEGYDPHQDPDGTLAIEAHLRSEEIELLEFMAESLLLTTFVRATGGEGCVYPRAGWQVAWDPTSADEDDEDGTALPAKDRMN